MSLKFLWWHMDSITIPLWFWNILSHKCAIHCLLNESSIVEYLSGFPFGANYKHHLRAHFWYMHLFLYFAVFHLDRVPEVGVLGFVAHIG